MKNKGMVLPTTFLILLGILVTPIIYNKAEENGMINIPEENPTAKQIERIGENMERYVTPNKEEYDTKLAWERKQEEQILSKIPMCQKPTECIISNWCDCLVQGTVCIPECVPSINCCPTKEPNPNTNCYCTMEYNPLCCNGKTFSNECEAKCQNSYINCKSGTCEAIIKPIEPIPPGEPTTPCGACVKPNICIDICESEKINCAFRPQYQCMPKEKWDAMLEYQI